MNRPIQLPIQRPEIADRIPRLHSSIFGCSLASGALWIAALTLPCDLMFLSADIWWLISKPDLPGWLDHILDPRIDKEFHLILTTVLLSVVALASVCLILTVFTEEKNLMIGSVVFTLGRFALTIDLWRQFLRSIFKNEELELDWLHTNYQWTTSNLVELFIYKICLQLNSIDLQILIILCSYFGIKLYILLHLNGYYIELGEDEDE